MAASTGMKTFTSSAIARTTSDGPEELTTEIDDIPVTFSMPDINQIVLMTALLESATSNIQAGAQLINIFFGLIKADEIAVGLDGEPLDDDDETDPEERIAFTDYTSRKLQAKMMKPEHIDPFGIEVIADVMRWLMEEWSARPTTPSSRSSVSPKRPGSTSRATQRGTASTRGASPR
jgi:hypothetical protein